jgi:pSer/pThr/pTyr-binding forkhead associated (FHA) protein
MSGVIVLALRLVLAACLYAFLGWALFSLWRELQMQGISLAQRKAPLLNLTLQRASGETTRHAFQQTEISIGRDPACDISLTDDSVSARHVNLSYHHSQWWAEDLGSTNGTRLNQAPLATPTVITTGDQIECGHTALIVSIGATADPSPTTRL